MALLKNITSGSVNGIVITGSLEVSNGITGSLFGTASWALNAVTAAFALNGGGGGGDISGSQYYAAIFSSTSALRTGSIYDSGSFTAIGAVAPVDPTNTERLFVDAGDTTSYNLISGHGTINNYLQLNVQNFSSADTASSDIVATADNGDETNFFIDMGINSSGYNITDGVGAANDAYLYNTGGDLLIGNASTNKRVIIFNGGTPALDNARVYITQEGSVGINASDVNLSNPEALLVEPLTGSSPTDFNNLIIGRGTINESYLQLNIINKGTGSYASADIVATNDAGTETSNYIDMGINSSNHTVDTTFAPGGPNDSYLLSTARDLLIGSSTTGSIYLWTGTDFDDKANAKLVLRPNNQHELIGSLNITGSINISGSDIVPNRIFGPTKIQMQDVSGSSAPSFEHRPTTTALRFGTTDIDFSLDNSPWNPYISFTRHYGPGIAIYEQNNNYRYGMGITPFALQFYIPGSLSNSFTWVGNGYQPITGTNELMRLTNGGNLSLNSTSSLGYKFYVNGTSLFGNNVTITGSLNAASITGSLFGTASWALNTLTASTATTAVTASYADNFTVAGTLTAQTIVVQTITSSIEYVTGSTIFGSQLSNTHQFTGSVFITGSLTSPNITGNLQGTASWATNAISSSYPIAVSGSTLYSVSPLTIPSTTNNSILLGQDAGRLSTNAGNSNFLGNSAGYSASSAFNSNFFGPNAGYDARDADNSNFVGSQAGTSAVGAASSNFFGKQAGSNAINAYESNFFGNNAGASAKESGYSNFLGSSAGFNAPFSDNSNFFGQNAGESAFSASFSNFIGYYAGSNASNAKSANFIGEYVGNYAQSASFSTFIGRQAGSSFNGTLAGSVGRNNIIIGHNITFTSGRQDSINLGAIIFATGSYFANNYTMFTGSVGNGRVGINIVNPRYNLDVSGSGNYTNGLTVTGSLIATSFTGSLFGTASYAINAASSSYPIAVTGSSLYSTSPAAGVPDPNTADNSIFLGVNAGYLATNARYSNFLGPSVGYLATNANDSNFLGNEAGYSATNANNSNFFGVSAGNNATEANNSNFLGNSAGYDATYANYSNFLGWIAGFQATNAYNSNFLGGGAGDNATNANNSNFLGNQAGRYATDAYNSNFLGQDAGNQATNAYNSNFLGQEAGINATNANNSNFLGSAGIDATNANDSNFLGAGAGYQATDAAAANFLGGAAGENATNAYNSNFLGPSAGGGATNANNSNFLGGNAGRFATDAYNSNFLGDNAGYGAANATYSNFLGANAGYEAINASRSNFFGVSAGNGATNADHSNFIGTDAGRSSTSASYSTLIGYQVGYNAAAGALGIKSNNIIIGTNITLADGTQDSINLGGVIFATGSYSTTTGNPFSGSVGGRVGINIVSPRYTLDVSGSGNFTNGLTVTGSANVTLALTASAALISGSGTQRLTVVGSGSAQPIFTVQGSQGELFSVTDSLSGSLFSVNDISGLPILEVFSDNTTLMGNYLAPSLNTTVRVTTTNSGSFTVYSVPTASYDGLFMEYTAKSGSAARAGQFMAIWSGSSVNYTDNSTTDFGDTSRLAFTGSISGSNMVVTGNVTTGSGWTIKSIIRSI